MEPLIVLIVLPVVIGATAEMIFRDTQNASLAAALACPVAVFLCLSALDPDDAWSWLATLLVSPLAIALALVTVLVGFGRTHGRKRNRGRDA